MVANTKEQGVRLFVYALCEPDGKTVRYVGLTGDLWKRLRSHYTHPCIRKVRDWIHDLRSRGLIPSMIVLREVVGIERGLAAEAEEIKRHPGLLNQRETGKPADHRKYGRIAFGGRVLTKSQWAKELGISKQALNLRLMKYPADVALSRSRCKGNELGSSRAPQFDGGCEEIAINDPMAIKPDRVTMSREERRKRREEMAAAIVAGEHVIDVAARFHVTTALVNLAVRETKHRDPPLSDNRDSASAVALADR